MPPEDGSSDRTGDPTQDWMRLVAAMQPDVRLGGGVIGPGLLAALSMGLAGDSRGFANTFEIAHALVLREMGVLADELGLIAVTREDARTQRRFAVLTEDGDRLIREARKTAGL